LGGRAGDSPERPRINTGQSGVSGNGSPPVGSRGTVLAGYLGPQKLKIVAHLR